VLKVTGEKVQDGMMMRRLVKHVLDNHEGKNGGIKSALSSDGVYGSNENLKILNDEGIEPAIKARKNSIISSGSNRMRRNREIMQQTRDFLKRKRREGMDRDGLLKQSSCLSRECFANMHLLSGFKTW
jgi:hypothetical protein